ncbi:MAG: PAS domain-containing protein [Spirochaetota bacterium]
MAENNCQDEDGLIGNWEWDISSGTVWLSDEIYAMFQRPRPSNHIDLSTFFSYLHESEICRVRDMVDVSVKSRYPLAGQIRIRVDRGDCYVYVRSELVCDSDGTPVMMIGVMKDISERRQIEKLLREREKLTYALINAADDFVIIADKDGIIAEINDFCARRFGKKRSELIGQSLWDNIPRNDVSDKRKSLLSKVFETGEKIRYEDFCGGYWSDIYLYPIFSGNGAVERVGVLGRDVTEMKKLEESLHRSEKLAHAVLNIPTDLIFIADRRGVVSDANEPALRYCNRTCSDIIGISMKDLVMADDREAVSKFFSGVFDTGQHARFVFRSQGKECDCVIYPVESENGAVTRVAVAIRDICKNEIPEGSPSCM